MTAKECVKILLAKECMTLKSLADKATKHSKKKITADSISQKLNKGTMKYNEAQFLGEILGYQLAFIKYEKNK